MNRITQDWKSPLAILIAVLLLYFVSLRVDARRPVEVAPKAPAAAPAPDSGDGKPIPNEIPELQQLG